MENKSLYIINHSNFFERIILKKRNEIIFIIKNEIRLNKLKIKNILDIGTTSDNKSKSSNYIIKNLNITKRISAITIKEISLNIFDKVLVKSITKPLKSREIKKYRADLVVSNATIEHVGKLNNQKKMLINIGSLTKKIFFISTPYRFFPIEVHTKIPLLHFLPKKIFRKLLKMLNLNFFSKEQNLNLLDLKDIQIISSDLKKEFKLKIIYIRTFFFISNLILIGIKK
jgi:hypothetical protein